MLIENPKNDKKQVENNQKIEKALVI